MKARFEVRNSLGVVLAASPEFDRDDASAELITRCDFVEKWHHLPANLVLAIRHNQQWKADIIENGISKRRVPPCEDDPDW